MKRIYSLLLAIAMLLLSGCISGTSTGAETTTEADLQSTSPEIQEEGKSSDLATTDAVETWDPRMTKTLGPNFDPEPFIKEGKNAYECITDTYAETDIVKRYIGYYYFSLEQSNVRILQEVNAFYPIQYLHRRDKNNVYAVYKTKEGGMYYMFFWNANGELPWDQDDDKIGYYDLIRSAYMTKSLSYADFDGIQVGDPISKVKALEPAVDCLEEVNSIVDDGKRFLSSTHILTDGLLNLSYEAPEGEELRVTNISYIEDFTQSIEQKVPDWGSYTLKHNLKIEPEDYPR